MKPKMIIIVALVILAAIFHDSIGQWFRNFAHRNDPSPYGLMVASAEGSAGYVPEMPMPFPTAHFPLYY